VLSSARSLSAIVVVALSAALFAIAFREAWKALGTFVALIAGGSIGREGPLIQFGAGMGGSTTGPPIRAAADMVGS